MKVFESLSKENLSKISLLKEEIEKEELTRLKFNRKEYDEIINYCSLLGYLVHKKENGKVVMEKGQQVYASPSINNQMKTIKIFDSKHHKWGYLQKLKNGIFYGYFTKDSDGNSKFVPKYNFNSNLEMFKIFSNLKSIDLVRLKAAAGIVEFEL